MTGELFSRHEAETRGGPRPERSTTLTPVRRNVWTDQPADNEDARYLQRVLAADRTLTGDRIYSHESAAVLLGLPVFGRWPKEVHLITERRSGGRSQLDVVRHCLGLEDVPTRLVQGVLVTSPARTAFDIALTPRRRSSSRTPSCATIRARRKSSRSWSTDTAGADTGAPRRSPTSPMR